MSKGESKGGNSPPPLAFRRGGLVGIWLGWSLLDEAACLFDGDELVTNCVGDDQVPTIDLELLCDVMDAMLDSLAGTREDEGNLFLGVTGQDHFNDGDFHIS